MNDTNTKAVENTAIDINPIPYLTWTWLKINKDSVAYDFSLTENPGKELQLPEGLSVSSGKTVKTQLSEPKSSIGEEASKFISACIKEGKIYTFEANAAADTKPLIIRISADTNSASQQIIHAKSGADAKVIIVYEGGYHTESTLSAIITKVYAEADSKVHITKVQLCGKAVNQIDDTQIICGERAKVSLTQIELGASHIDAGFHASLEGYQSEFYSDTAYICQGKQYLDMNQVVVHKGQKTICDMKTHGTAKDEASKTYRGTIDLIKGCTGSNGNEIETTLLLSPKAVVKAAPIILCGEEDISAEHGSTIGKLSNDMLFYMNSRGIDQKTAEELLTNAKITAAAATIEDETVRKEIEEFLQK